MEPDFKNRDIVAIDDFSRDELVYLVEKAEEMRRRDKEGKRFTPELTGKKLFYMFYEPSTRTVSSFKTAISELGGIHDGFSGIEGTSVKKKESLFMTVKMAEANHSDVIVLRHHKDGSAQWAADVADIPVINGGDGRNEHPTQTLLDIVTINQIVPGIDGAHIGFGGDLKYGRTTHSLPIGLSKFNDITLHLAAPEALAMPEHLVKMLESRGMKVIKHGNVEDALKASQVFYMTRPQTLKMKQDGVNEQDIYAALERYRITIQKLESNPGVKLMHPLPIDSELAEIDFAVIFTDNQYFLQQAENGIFLRKDLLLEILSGTKQSRFLPSGGKMVTSDKDKIELITDYVSRKSGLYVDSLKNGAVIDHIDPGKAQEIVQTLKLDKGPYPVVTASNLPSTRRGRKDVIKIIGGAFSDRMVKLTAMISPDATFSRIEDEKVVEKFRALLCDNQNCITRDVHEDAPVRFYLDGNELKCHYCNTPHESEIDEKPKYMVSLRGSVYLSEVVEEIKARLRDLRKRDVLNIEEYSKISQSEDKEFTEEQEAYLKEVQDLALVIHQYVLDSFFFIGYDGDNRCSIDHILTTLKKRRADLEFEDRDYAYGRLIRQAEQYGEENFLTRITGTEVFELKPDARDKKDELIAAYKAGFEATPYITANMLGVISEVRI